MNPFKQIEFYEYNDTIKPPAQSVAITVNDKVFSSYQNFSVLVGAPKSRKSTVGLALLMAHNTGKEIFNFKVKKEGKVVYIDTEQSTYNFYQSFQRVKKYAGVDHLNPDLYNAYLFRMLDPADIMDNIELILATNPDIKLLILDSITDLIFDINNIAESRMLTQKFKTWSTKYNISICGLLHLAKTNSYALGHIGSFCERGSESMALISKNKDNPYQSHIKSVYMRSDIDFDSFDINFENDSYDITEPITGYSTRSLKPEEMDLALHLKHLNNIKAVHYNDMSYRDLQKFLKSRYQKGDTYIKGKLIPFLREEKLIVQVNKLYQIKC